VKQDSAGEDVHGSRIAAGEILRARARRGAGSRGCPRCRLLPWGCGLGATLTNWVAYGPLPQRWLVPLERSCAGARAPRGAVVWPEVEAFRAGGGWDARSVERTRPFSAFAPARCDHAERPHFLRIPTVRGHRSPGGRPGLCALGAALCA
jgi:hypothetical protein